jgi:hypothetical protein
MDIYSPFNLIAAYEVADKESMWLRDNFFPCNPATDLFNTDEVYVEIKDKGNRLTAPFVIPEVGGRYIERTGYRTSRIAPPFMGLKTKLTIDDLKKKGFGEAYFQQVSPETRARKLLVSDMEEMEKRFARSEEMMCAKLLTGNGYELKHFGAEDNEKFQNYQMKFFKGSDDPTKYTPSANWSKESDALMGDIEAMADILEDNQQEASVMIVAGDVGKVIYHNAAIREDIKTYSNIDAIQGKLSVEIVSNTVKKICTLNVGGRWITVYSYTGKYIDPETGKEEFYIPSGTAILTAPNCGKMLYGCVDQMDPDTKEFDSIAAKRVPKMIFDVENDTRRLRIASRPLAVPAAINPFVHAKVL